MRLLPKVLIVLLLVPILSVPVAAVVAFFLTPLWSWIELTYQIESIGHSGPAEWCFVAVYLGLVTFSLGSLAPGAVLLISSSCCGTESHKRHCPEEVKIEVLRGEKPLFLLFFICFFF